MRLLLLTLLPSLFAIEAFGWWWARPEPAAVDLPRLGLTPPAGEPTFQELPGMLASAQEMLRCDRGHVFTVTDDLGVKAQVAWFEWDGEEGKSTMEAFGHLPERCMGTVGMTLAKRFEPRVFEENGVKLRFDSTLFTGATGKVVLYKALWVAGQEDVMLRPTVNPTFSPRWQQQSMRLEAVARRLHQRPARVLTIAVSGAHSEQHAWQVMRREVLAGLAL